MTGNRASGRAGGGRGASPPSPPPRGRAGAGAGVYAPTGRRGNGGPHCPRLGPSGVNFWSWGPGAAGAVGSVVWTGKRTAPSFLHPRPPLHGGAALNSVEMGGGGPAPGVCVGGGACNYRPAQARGIHISQS